TTVLGRSGGITTINGSNSSTITLGSNFTVSNSGAVTAADTLTINQAATRRSINIADTAGSPSTATIDVSRTNNLVSPAVTTALLHLKDHHSNYVIGVEGTTAGVPATIMTLNGDGVFALKGGNTTDITTVAAATATALTIQPATPTSSGGGGALNLNGGTALTSGTGGNVVITGGTGVSNTGGNVTIDAGTGSTAGAINIGTTNSTTTTVGRSGGALVLNGSTSSTITLGTNFQESSTGVGIGAAPTSNAKLYVSGALTSVLLDNARFYAGYQSDGTTVQNLLGVSTGNATLFRASSAGYIFQNSSNLNKLTLDDSGNLVASGSLTGTAVSAGSGTILTTGSVYGNTIDRSTSGTLTLGGNATTISVAANVLSVDGGDRQILRVGSPTFNTAAGNSILVLGESNLPAAPTVGIGIYASGSSGNDTLNISNSNGISFTKAGTATIQPASSQALTITAHNTSVWSTDSGNLTVDAAGAINLGTANSTSTSLGKSGTTLTINPTSWTATPTISGVITATSGLTSNGAITIQNN